MAEDERLGASFSIDVTNLKTGLTQANALIRESQSEFKKAAAGMDDWTKSEDGLSAKIKSLTDITAIQKEKVKLLNKEYDEYVAVHGKASSYAVTLKTQINNEEAALRSNEAELKRQTSALQELGEESEEAGKSFDKLGEFAQTAGKVAVAAFTAAAAAVGALVKSSLDNYAEYEQLVGGVETLFKDSADTVEKYANNAYKTAGMSANEYMETVTSFSASLLQSLGGDTAQAAEVADMAIRDMSDNANKMGTSIESIQNAYGGFAKQNFTMLDNLKLGYGGTKEEMERLLEDAQKLSGIEYDISSYSDIVEAIHVVQDEMGITGTTAKEASSTIQGSIASMGSAWQNLLTGLADENADFDQLIENLIDSIATVIENILPRIKIIITGIIDMIKQLLPQIPPLIADLLPELLDGATALIQGLIEILPTVIDAVIAILPDLIKAILNMLPDIVSAVLDIVTALGVAIAEMLPDIVDAIMDVLPALIDALLDAYPKLLEASFALFTAIIAAIPDIIEKLVGELPKIVSTIVSTLLENLPLIIEGAIQLFMGLITAIPQITIELVKAIPQIIVGIVQGLIDGIPKLIDAGKEIFGGLFNGISQGTGKLAEWASGAWDGIKNAFSSVGSFFKDTFSDAAKKVGSIFGSLKTSASNGWQGIKDVFGTVGNFFKDTFSKAWKKVKEVFSPIGEVFVAIKDGIVSVFKTVVNGIIKGINAVVKLPFEGFNKVLDKIYNLSILNLKPFSWLTWRAPIPQIPELAEGGVVRRATHFIAGEDGAEAVMPLEKNTEWMDKLAEKISEKNGGRVAIYQTNNYSQAHSRYEIYKSKQQTEAAVRLALGTV